MDFTLVIRGDVDSAVPPLTLAFTMSSLHLARLYAKKTSLKIANRDYNSFALFRQDEVSDMVQEWKVTLVPTIIGDTANDH
jgi:hypothetical protein